MSNRRRGIIMLLLAGLFGMLATTLVAGPAQAASSNQVPNYGNRKCMDLDLNTIHVVQLWTCNGQPQQQWQQESLGNLDLRLTNVYSNGCLGVEGDATTEQSHLANASCDAASTRWHIAYSNNENFDGWHQQLVNTNSGLCLDLQFNNATDGTPLWLWHCTDERKSRNTAQLWMLTG